MAMASGARTWRVPVVAAAVTLLLALLVWSLRRDGPPPPAAVPPTREPGATAAGVASGPVPAPESAHVERTAAAEPAPATTTRTTVAPAVAADHVAGRVRLDTLEPAVGAAVRIGTEVAQTDAAGVFSLRRDRVHDGDALVATLTGYEPVRLDDVARTADFQRGRPLEVVLPGKASSIDGWLVDASGTPCAGWKLELYRGTDAGPIGFPNLLAEDLAAGAQPRPYGDEMSAGQQNPNLQRIGADGAFRIGGLRRGHDYVLRAWNEHTLVTALSEPLAAGVRGHRFVVPATDCRDRVYGRALDRHGAPLSGVRVRLTMREHESGGSTSYQTGQEARTAADGFFEFRQVPRQDLLLRCDGHDLDGVMYELRAADPGLDLRIVLGCLCRFRFEARSPLPGATLRMLDANDQPLPMSWELAPGQTRTSPAFALEHGRSPELLVSDAAAWLSVRVGDRVLVRDAIRLVHGTTTVLRD